MNHTVNPPRRQPRPARPVNMNFTEICLIGMLILLKFQTDPGARLWTIFAIIVVTLALIGYPLGMVGLVIALGLWKVFADLVRAA